LEKDLVIPLEVLFEDDDTADLDMSVLLSETRFPRDTWRTGGRRDRVRAGGSRRVERLGPTLVAVSAIGVEQVAAFGRQDHRPLVFTQRDGPDQPFVAE